jgi:hypothetical protein
LLYLMSELACQVKRRVTSVGLDVDGNRVVSRQQLDHIKVAYKIGIR